jgi:hypothetical protein
MSYALKFDANNQAVSAIEELIPVRVDLMQEGTITVEVPGRVFSFGAKRVPTDVEININGTGFFPLDEGDQFGNFLDIHSIEVKASMTVMDDLVLLFSR